MTATWFSARGGQLVITVDEGYLKAYVRPLDENGEPVGNDYYGLQGRPREAVDVGVRTLVDEFLRVAREADLPTVDDVTGILRESNSQGRPE